MQLLVDQSSFSGALQTLGRIVPRRPVTPVVASVLIEASGTGVILRATDLQSYAEVTLPADVHMPGTVAVGARFLQGIAATLHEGEVALSLSDSGESLRITSGPSAFRLQTIDASDFPVQKAPASGWDLSIETERLIDLVSRTTFCATDSDDVSPFAGVLITAGDGELTIAATDSYQLAYYSLEARSVGDGAGPAESVAAPNRSGRGLEAVVPTQGLTALTRALSSQGGEEVRLAWEERSLWFLSGPVAWRLRRLDLQYPDLRRFTGPLAGIRVPVGRDRLLDAVRQVASIADEGRAVGLRIDRDRLHVFASHREVGEAQTVLALQGDFPRCEVWVDAARLTSALRAQPAPEVALHVSEPSAPVAILPGDDQIRYRSVLMPLRHYVLDAELA